ncbi:TPA: hypothetical protein QDB10_003377 [Burkholderia vietnamiensis]|nr:hypothetical protein [Burkholderia vietnamiensis]
MRLFSYVVARDYGFAPNPFGGVCSLATCEPDIRQTAAVGDWIVGLSSLADRRPPGLVYVMRVDEVLTYDTYWTDQRFHHKKPSRFGSVKQMFGDNIYHRDGDGQWRQADSHHSLANGSPNPRNIENDTKSTGVLIGRRFAYWGSAAIAVPQEFEPIFVRRGYRNGFASQFVADFVAWFESLGVQGFQAAPFKWQRPQATWARPAV